VILHWFISGVLSNSIVGAQGEAFKLDKNYRASDTWLRVKTASQGVRGTGLAIDINDDGTSIYSERPNLPDNTQSITSDTFAPAVLLKDSVITLDIDSVGVEYAGFDLTVELTLEED
jgi:hypothetical protein